MKSEKIWYIIIIPSGKTGKCASGEAGTRSNVEGKNKINTPLHGIVKTLYNIHIDEINSILKFSSNSSMISGWIH